jgi:hypothetical protein
MKTNCIILFIWVILPLVSIGQWRHIGYVDNPGQAIIAPDGTIFSFSLEEGPTPQAGGKAEIFRNMDTLATSFECTEGPESIYKIFFLSKDTGFISGGCYGHGYFLHTTNSCISWTSLPCQLFEPIPFYVDFTYHPGLDGFSCTALNTSSMRISNCINNILFDTIIHGYHFNYLDQVYYADQNIGFIITTDTSFSPVVIRTSNGGRSWNPVLKSHVDLFNKIQFTSSAIGYIIGKYGIVYKTTDGGLSWKQSVINQTEVLNDLSFINDSFGYVSASSGKLFYTHDGATTWEESVSPTTRSILHVRFINDSTGYIIATSSTFLGDVFTNAREGSPGMIDDSKMFSNALVVYPNPGHDHFSVQIPETFLNGGFLKLELFNSNGKCVKTIISNEPKKQLGFSLEQEPSGIYFARLVTDYYCFNGRFFKD